MNQGATGPAAPTTDKAAGKKAQAADGIPTREGWYVVGLRPYNGQVPPRYSVTFGGVSFPQFSQDENPTIKNDSIEFNQRRVGQRVWLDSYALEAIRAACGKKIVRTRSEAAGRFAILAKDSPDGRRPLKNDVPLEKFLYIEPAEAPEEDRGVEEANLPPSIA